jgi:predicted  nucleic acid-binding Zn-ribbon protein
MTLNGISMTLKARLLTSALKLEYDKICERKEDLKFKYREANKHFGDLSKVCMGEAAVIKQRIERVHQRIQATDTTIEQMRRKFDHLDNVVKTNSKSEFIDSNRDAAETSQELKRFIVSISHTQIHRDNLDKEYTNLNQKLQQQTEQSNVFHNRHKQRVEIMTSICEQFDWELKIVHQHMVQLDKLRKIIDTEVSV